MKEIVSRLHEKRQIELAKSILENAGYKVEKISEYKSNGSYDTPGEDDMIVYSDDSMDIESQMYYSSDEEEILDFIRANPAARYVYDPFNDENLSLYDFLIDVIGMSHTEAENFMKDRQ